MAVSELMYVTAYRIEHLECVAAYPVVHQVVKSFSSPYLVPLTHRRALAPSPYPHTELIMHT